MYNYIASMIEGLVASDAGLRLKGNPNKANATFYLTSKYESFLIKVSKIMSAYGFQGKIRKHNPGRIMQARGEYSSFRYETKTDSHFTQLYYRWYPQQKKIFPKGVNFTPVFLSYLYSGDGHNQLMRHNKSRRIILCTESFTKSDQKHVITEFAKIGIYAHLEKVRNAQVRVVISVAADVKKFLDLVKPFILPEFTYKIRYPELVRTKFTRLKTPDIKKMEIKDPVSAQKLYTKKINEHRRAEYAADQIKRQKARNRAKKRYLRQKGEKNEY